MKKECKLKFFPVSFFAIILWLWGFTIVLQKLEQLLSRPTVSNIMLRITIGVLILQTIIYTYKIIKFPTEVKKERNHPIKINFFPTFPKGLLILSIAFIPVSIIAAKYLWIAGAIINLVLTLLIFKAYIDKPFEIKHINPARFIPIVTNIVIPITWIAVFPQYSEISRFFFSIWIIFWLVLFIIFFYRAIFHHPLTNKLLPTFAILMAPPAIGCIAYVKLNWSIDNFSNILFYLSGFLFLFILTNIEKFLKIKFYLSRWAYSFPMAALTLVNFLMYHETHQIFFKYTSIFLSIILTVIVILLIRKTIANIKNHTICI